MKKIIPKILGVALNLLAWIHPKAAGRRGFLLFCRPFRTPVTDKQKDFFDTADQSTITSEGVNVQVYRWGKGEKKVVFFHGWQSHSYRWKAYIDALPKDAYTIYALDAPGHGRSGGNFLSVPVYGTLIQKFIQDIGGAQTVVGHSLGSFSLIYTFFRNPSLPVDNVILMAPPGEASDFMTFYKDTLRLSNRAMKHIYQYFEQTYKVPPAYFSTKKFAASLSQKGLIIHDEGDDEAPYHYAVKINEVWKKSTLISTQGFGHNLKSPTVVEAVFKFIHESNHASLTVSEHNVN
ncbi:Serine aminopeptidase, S33 [Chryseolinea serpens]|uniref:Serine aminopeptidase, S33 n=1 Tax=Chryseolinea serpens TaxID=947013 RepID=A0A1M5QQT8_9BACT|nr:alpha/beta hydrolase [Chryseolinea serpens]SHH16149.1 Serine aminopeptidase, S33 [Chryseolinea serpens]